jgi:uncharacterized protein (TIGR00369 family)
MSETFLPPHVKAILKKLFEEDVAFQRTMGIRIVSFNPERPRMRFDMHPDLIGHPVRKVLHGGVIASALDSVAGFGVLLAMMKKHKDEPYEAQLARFMKLGTIDLRVDYIRPGSGAHFIASAHVFRAGGKIASVRMELENDSGELIAAGAGAFIVG